MPKRDPASDTQIETPDETRADALTRPDTHPATNLLLADIIVRSASKLWRRRVDDKVAEAGTPTDEDGKQIVDGRTMLTTLGLYGASKLANKSVSGLALVASGLVAKTLYDRGKARQKRLANEEAEQDSE